MAYSPVSELIKSIVLINRQSDIPVYLQIANSLIYHIRRGALRKNVRLPGSRELAILLKVHRLTVVAAYDELVAQGWIEIVARKGTFVAKNLPDIKPIKLKEAQHNFAYPEKTNFVVQLKKDFSFGESDFPEPGRLIINDGFPDTRLAPVDLIFRTLRSQSQQPVFKKYYQYGSAQGALVLRQTLANYLSDTRGLPINPNNLLITKGAQMGLYLSALAMLKPGDEVVVGEPSYLTASLTFQYAGATVNRVSVDEYGINVAEVEKLCMVKKIRMVYIIPHHHHPTTVTLIPERRLQLLQLAARYKLAIIEDDYDYDFQYGSRPVLPLASLDHAGNVIYIGTLTKTLLPSIRLGFVVAPQNLINTLADMRRLVDWQGDSIMEAAIAELYRNGSLSQHIKKMVRTYEARRDHFCSLLDKYIGKKISFKIPNGGMAVWARFNTDDVRSVAPRAAKKGLQINDGATYNRYHNYNAIRMGFASLNFQEQTNAIKLLRQCL